MDDELNSIKEILESTNVKIPVRAFETYINNIASTIVSDKINMLDRLIQKTEDIKIQYGTKLNELMQASIANKLPEIINEFVPLGWMPIHVESGEIVLENNIITIIPNKIKTHRGTRVFDKQLTRYKIRGIRLYIKIYDGKLRMIMAYTLKRTYHPNVSTNPETDFDGSLVYRICMGTVEGAEFTKENLNSLIDELHMLNMTSAYRRSRHIENDLFYEGKPFTVMEVIE